MEKSEKKKRAIIIFIFGIIFVVLVFTLVNFYIKREERLSAPENTILELNAALLTNDVASLAVFFDFFTIQKSILNEIKEQAEGTRLEPLYLEKMPTKGETDLFFATIFMALSKNEAMPKVSLDGKTVLLPNELSDQMRAGQFELIQATDGEYFVRISISLPYMNTEYLIFSLEKFGKRWRLKDIVNTSRFVSIYNTAVISLEDEAKSEIINHNADAILRMNEYIPNVQCIVKVEYIDQHVPKIKISVETDPLQVVEAVSSWGFNAEIKNSAGKILMEPDLLTRGFFAADIPIKKILEKDITEEEYEILNAEEELNCSIVHKFIRLQDDTLINFK